MKPLIIGEAPSKNEDPRTIVTLGGRVGRRLAACAGITLDEFLERFERVNLLEVRQDTKEKGFEFNLPMARARACELVHMTDRNRVVILLGRRVAKAFGIANCLLFENIPIGGGLRAFVMPHPSSINHWWNDEKNVQKASAFMRRILRVTSETGETE